MNARCLKFVLFLVLCVGTCDASVQTVPMNSEACTTALLKDRETLSTFYEAIERDDADRLVILIESAAWDVETMYWNGQRFLYLASFLGRVNSIEALVSQLKIDVNISNPDENNWTALHYAVLNNDKSSRLDSFYTLIKLGADINVLDAQGHEPLWYISWFHTGQSKTIRVTVEIKKRVVELLLNYPIEPAQIKKLLQLGHYHTLYQWINLYGEDSDKKEAVLEKLSKREKKYPPELKDKIVQRIVHGGEKIPDIVKELNDVPASTIAKWVEKHRKEHGLLGVVSTESPPEAEVEQPRTYISRNGDDKHSDLLIRVNASDGLYSLAIEDLLEGRDIKEILEDFPSLDRRTLEHHHRMYLLKSKNR